MNFCLSVGIFSPTAYCEGLNEMVVCLFLHCTMKALRNSTDHEQILDNDIARRFWQEWLTIAEVVVVVAFSSRARILGECSTFHSPPALFFFNFFFMEISSRALIPLFRPGSVHSG